MVKNFSKLLLFVSVAVMALGMQSCSKDDAPKPLNLVGKWKQTSGKYTPDFEDSDYFSDYPPCYQDDILTFKADNTFEWSEGATKCDDGDPNIFGAGVYSIDAHSKVLTMMLSSGPSVSVATLNGTKLTLVSTFDDEGTIYKDTQTFEKQN